MVVIDKMEDFKGSSFLGFIFLVCPCGFFIFCQYCHWKFSWSMGYGISIVAIVLAQKGLLQRLGVWPNIIKYLYFKIYIANGNFQNCDTMVISGKKFKEHLCASKRTTIHICKLNFCSQHN